MTEKDAEFYDQQYKSGHSKLFEWGPGHRSRLRISLGLMKKYNFSAPYLDVGCGSGQMLKRVKKEFGWKEITGADFSTEALSTVESSGFQTLGIDLTRSENIERKFKSLTCLQVLEHIENDTGAINNLFTLLVPGGQALITVPYSKKYWSPMDARAGHQRRYSGKNLSQKLTQAGFEIQKRVIWGAVIYNIYYRLLRFTPSNFKNFNASGPPPVWKRLVSFMLYLFFYLDDLFTFLNQGPRLFIIARKPE